MKKTVLGVLVAMAFAVSSIGCSDGGGGTGGGSGGGTGGGSSSTCTMIDGTCNALTSFGADVVAQRASTTPPTGVGGTVVAGTYYLTASTEYQADAGTGPTGYIRASTFVFSAVTSQQFTMQQVQRQSNFADGGCELTHETDTAWFDGGTTMFVRMTCPVCDGGSGCSTGGSLPYTATPTTFTIFETKSVTNVETYTKQ